jgi:hypothetical protein
VAFINSVKKTYKTLSHCCNFAACQIYGTHSYTLLYLLPQQSLCICTSWAITHRTSLAITWVLHSMYTSSAINLMNALPQRLLLVLSWQVHVLYELTKQLLFVLPRQLLNVVCIYTGTVSFISRISKRTHIPCLWICNSPEYEGEHNLSRPRNRICTQG